MSKKRVLLIIVLAISFLLVDVQAKEGWVEENGEKYYYENNQPVSGWKTINGNNYFFGLTTHKLLHGWQYWNGKFYLDKEGKVTQGWNNIDGEKYYVKDNYMVNKFQTIDGKTYFFGLTSYRLLHGWQYWNGKFYLDKEGKVTQGWNTIDGEKYYVKDNYMVNQFQTIDGETYFFGLTTNKLLHGWQSWNGKAFYLDSEGKVKQGWNEINGEKYYVVNNYMVNRFQTIEGKRYFFGITTYKLLHGWQSQNGNYWYQDNDGVLVTGNQHIDARDYKFGDDGIVQGFKTVNGKKYYYDPNGTMVKGVQRMCGTYMMFNSLTGVFEKTVNQKRVIDISVHNGNVNWDKVKESGLVDGVILRSSFGVGYTDGKFERNVKELNRLGIPYSVYHFSYAENKAEAKREADYLISVLNKYPVKISSNLFSIYYDLEDWEISSTGENSYGISKNTYADMITTFANTVQKATGIKVRVYASKNYIETRFPASVQGYATWVAQWSDHITYKGAYEGWQYTSKGKVPGIEGNVDMSIFYY